MATIRELKNKIRSISNTKKITRTMEMISTAKAQVCRRRIEAAQPYGNKLAEILSDLRVSGEGASSFPLLRVPDKPGKEVVFVITANRGLCGGYNSNVLKLAEKHCDSRQQAGVDVEVHMVGKKGISKFRYLKREVAQSYIQFDDKATFQDAEEVIEPVLDRFARGDIDGVSLVATHYVNATRQEPMVVPLLPIPEGHEGESHGGGAEFIFEPSPEAILSTLLPLSLKTQFFQWILEASTSEQIARRVAMKNATDNAEEMVKETTRIYNRQRQAGITQEILEVIGGAAATG